MQTLQRIWITLAPTGSGLNVWHKYQGLFVRMYVTYQQSYLSKIKTRQTSLEAYSESTCKSRGCSAP